MHIFNRGKSKKGKKEPKPGDESKDVVKPEPVAKAEKPAGTGPVAGPEPAAKPKTSVMVPIFSWRTALVAAIGLILGVLISLVYWIISPSLSPSADIPARDSGGTGLLGLLGIEPEGPYQSKIRIQIVSPGSEYIPLKNLQQMGEYYSAKANSLPFLEFLNQKLTEQMPEFTYDVDRLSQMFVTEYDTASELPNFKVTVTAPTEREAIGLAGLIPEDFRDYLIAEEKDKTQKEYDKTLEEIASVREALYNAQQELNEFIPGLDLETNPSYISLKARADSLQQMLDGQASQLAEMDIGNTDIQTMYYDTVSEINFLSNKLEAARRESQTLEEQKTERVASDNASQILLNSKINALQAELDKTMNGYTVITETTTIRVLGLAEMIADGDTSSLQYTNTLIKAETISYALDEAYKELNNLRNQAARNLAMTSPDYLILQIKIDTYNAQLSVLHDELSQLYQQILSEEQKGGQPDLISTFNNTAVALAESRSELSDLEKQLGFDRLAADLDYKISQDKVDNLNDRLRTLSEQLSLLVGGNSNSVEADYLVAGSPTVPSPVLPERSAARSTIIIGAVAGMIIAWGALNFRWIKKNLFSSGTTEPEGDGEEE